MKIFMVVEEEDAWRHSAFYMLDHAFSSAFSSLLSFGFYNAKLMRGAYISRLKQLVQVQCTQACTGRIFDGTPPHYTYRATPNSLVNLLE
jgi:hypothetical protein